jgi:CBS-domain-containing membrane protein
MKNSSISSAMMAWLGIERNQTSHNEKLISALGAAISIGLTVLLSMWLVTHGWLSHTGSMLIISSMGASAVLLFAVPHGVLSQPWPVFGGHLISAFIGVSCAQFLPAGFVTAGLAVGLAVAAMYYLRCIHPPGGATALTAVVGGSQVIHLGYWYLLFPILLNLGSMLFIALLFNYLFKWRRYPAHFNTRSSIVQPAATPVADYVLTTEDFNAAIQKLDSFVDITEEGLTELLEQARQAALDKTAHPGEIKRGRFYSNGNIGRLWQVRQVIDDDNDHAHQRDLIIYKTVAGQEATQTGYCEREVFRNWARFEVTEHNGMWVKAGNDPVSL